ncbi:MAG: FAD/NAD(P)-binding protein [Phenylobacterium sp.]
MSGRVRIVGGGLTGILAALQAHALGARDIELHERFDGLGGVALPRSRHGLELRDGCIYFGPPGDPIRTLLEQHGLAFDDFDNRFGAISLDAQGALMAVGDFGGPSYPVAETGLTAPAGDSLADRIACYPPQIAGRLADYCRWHLDGAALEAVHESAAIPLAVNRVHPALADVAALAARKRAEPLADELYAIPRQLWGWTNNLVASLPRGGFAALFAGCRRALDRLGVRVRETSLVSPRDALAGPPDETLVWTANPMPLFRPLGLKAPALVRKSFATVHFRADYEGPLPFYLQNFTAQGVVFRLYVYETNGQVAAVAECVAEAGDAALRAEVGRLVAAFPELRLTLGEQIAAVVGPRWIYHSVEAVAQLGALRAAAAARLGPRFVPGAWEPYAKAEKFAQVQAGLEAALRGRIVTAA